MPAAGLSRAQELDEDQMEESMKKMIKRMCLSVLALMVAAGSLIGSYGIEAHADDALPQERILLDDDAGEMQEYAAKELQKYLYQLFGTWLPIMDLDADTDVSHAFVLGTKEDAASLKPIEAEIESIGEQGYVLKKSEDTLYIGGHDDAGLLYGVYGLLDDHYGIGFYFSGDVIPEEQGEFYMPEVDEAKTPRQYMRGILPWTNFPQSSTVYSLEDWKYVIDQMARMRMNFLNIHNYNGQNGHNEMFHNFTYDGITSRNWNATAGSGHGWYGPAWDVNEYRFGASDLFDDYDFGMDATLHNDSLSNTEVFAKGYSMFQYIIQYAHSRGVKIGLGLDIDLVMPDYGVSADAPGLPELQAETVMANYEDLDTLILYISEMIVSDPAALSRWRDCFDRMYETVRAKRPDMQIAVSGWGISEEIARSLPDDVVIAPISNYSAGFVNGSEAYPGKEYWGGPWVERDFDSSVYYYPYNMELSDTVKAYQENKDTMQGLFTLTWRLSDAVDPKIMYIAKAPWDSEEKYQSAEDVYREYAQKCYGQENAEDMGKLLYADEKTVVPTTWSECNDTVQFTGADREADIARVQQMIDRVEQAMQRTDDRGNQARLDKLRNRLIGVQAYCRLDQGFNTTDWAHLQDDFATWARSFINRIDDISSLGNIVSTQNRFVQLRYVARETQLRNEQEIKAPLNVSAEGTADGAQISWEYEQDQADGFYVYRDGERISPLLSGSARTYADVYDQAASYTVRAVNAQGQEGEASIAQTCLAGSGDQEAPQVFVVSPPTSVIEGQDLQVKARVLDGRVDAAESEIDTLQTTTGQHTSQIDTINTTLSKKLDSDTAASTYQTLANKTTSVSGDSTDTQYPSAKAVWTAVQSVDANASVEALEGRVDSLETNSATKTELATKQNKNMGSSAANSIVTTDGTGNITASATIAASKVSGLADVATTGAYGDLSGTPSLGTLASKSTITSAEITDGTIAEADLNTTINASLDKADSALQKTTADATYAVKALEGQVGTVSKENMGTTTATTVVAGVKEAIDAAKAADTKAGSAASAASTAQSAAAAAQGAAEAAQADVDTLETTVSGQGTRLTAAEGEIDSIQSEMENMATSETVSGLQSTVTNLQSTKQDKTDNTLTTTNKTVVGAINEVKATADKKQDKLTGTVGGSMQPVYLNNGTITAGTALGTLATKSKVTNTEVDDGALAQSKINGLATTLAAKLTTPPTSERGETGLYVLTYDGTDFQWEDIARTVTE